jgi:lipase chaperone LimK
MARPHPLVVRGIAVALVAGIGVLAGFLIARRGEPPAALAPPSSATTPASPAAATAPATSTTAVAGAPASGQTAPAIDRVAYAHRVLAEGSLRGSTRDGRAGLGTDGQLLIDRDLRRLFDYYLTLAGELDAAGIRMLVAEDLAQQLPAAVVTVALDQYDRYVDYLRRASQLPEGGDLVTRLARLAELRRAVFGEAAAKAYFAEEEDYAERTVARLAVAEDRTLSEAQRAAALAELDARMPEQQRAAVDAANSASIAAAQTEHLDNSHADAATRDAERTALWGAEAAQRLAELDRQRAEWDRRIADYQAARDRLPLAGKSDAQRELAIAQLREQRFADPAERQRVEALEAVGALRGR